MSAFGGTLKLTPKLAREILARGPQHPINGGMVVSRDEMRAVQNAWRDSKCQTVDILLNEMAAK